MPLLYHPTVKLDLPTSGEWVELKSVLSRGDEEKRKARLASAATVGPDGKVGAVIDSGVIYEVAVSYTMELAIVSWSFEVPVSADAIGHLDDASFDAIKDKCEELYGLGKALSASQRKNSPAGGRR